MADKKISDLPVASAIGTSDISLLVSSGVDYQFAFSTLLELVGSGLAVGADISFGSTLPANITGKNGDVFINTSNGTFAQKISGTWTIVYTLPGPGSLSNGTVLFGLGVPGGPIGSNNDTYINTGTGIFYKKASGAWTQVFSMQTGPAGPAGAVGTNGTNRTNGFSLLNGLAIPSNTSTGVDGDFYIDTTTYTLYGPKSAGVWGTGVSMYYVPPDPIGIPFTSGGTNPLVKSDWQTDYFPTHGNGRFLVQFKDNDGNLVDRPDISIKRIIDRTGTPVQTGISMDQPGYPDGQIMIEYSNLPLI